MFGRIFHWCDFFSALACVHPLCLFETSWSYMSTISIITAALVTTFIINFTIIIIIMFLSSLIRLSVVSHTVVTATLPKVFKGDGAIFIVIIIIVIIIIIIVFVIHIGICNFLPLVNGWEYLVAFFPDLLSVPRYCYLWLVICLFVCCYFIFHCSCVWLFSPRYPIIWSSLCLVVAITLIVCLTSLSLSVNCVIPIV